jgi:hypothetical protein
MEVHVPILIWENMELHRDISREDKEGWGPNLPRKSKEICRSTGHPKKHHAPLAFDKEKSNENDSEEGLCLFKRDISPFFKSYNN